MTAEPLAPLSPRTHRELLLAIDQLERESFVARIAQVTGTPVDVAIKYLPRSVNQQLHETIKRAIVKCLDVAVNSLDVDEDLGPPPPWVGKLLTGISGGIGGFFGIPALALELPVTTALMLRSIAEIARDEGEDPQSFETRLACLEVFALGGGGPKGKNDLNLQYYAVRSLLSKLTRDLSRYVMERGSFNVSSPIVGRLVGEIASRFGFAVSNRAAASLVPVIGAIGGATVNVIFTDHFQRVARGHFVVRRLEREYGAALIRRRYAAAVAVSGPYRPRLEAAD
jgi:EcsC protein family